MSKKRRIPDGGMLRTVRFRKSAVVRRVAGRLVIAESVDADGHAAVL
jgi:hypothetical protein